MSRWRGRFCLRIARASASLPDSTASSRRSFENHALIFERARGEATNASQSREGPALSDFEVTTSTVSPDSSCVSSATRRPLTFAPTV